MAEDKCVKISYGDKRKLNRIWLPRYITDKEVIVTFNMWDVDEGCWMEPRIETEPVVVIPGDNLLVGVGYKFMHKPRRKPRNKGAEEDV